MFHCKVIGYNHIVGFDSCFTAMVNSDIRDESERYEPFAEIVKLFTDENPCCSCDENETTSPTAA